MTGVQILLLVIAILLVAAAGLAVWIRRRRTGHVLIASARADAPHLGDRS